MARTALFAALFAAAATGASAQDGTVALLERADSAWVANDRTVARDVYQRIVDSDSTASSRAVFRLATLLSWSNDLPRSIALFRLYTRLEPGDDGGRVALARTLAWASRFDESVALYDRVVARDSTARDAVLGAAQALAWASKLGESTRRYERWTAAHPDDIEARLSLAQTLAWDGRLREAEAMYAHLSDEGAGIAAEKGVARIAAWRGDLTRSEQLWRGLAARFPGDPEIWTGLAQVLRWSGHPGAARTALGSALLADPRYGDARSQLAWVDADLSSALEPSVISSFDRDRNYSTLATLSASIPTGFEGRLVVTASRREASLGERYGAASLARGSATALRVAASRTIGQRLTLRGEAGATRLSPRAGDVAVPAPGRTVTIGSWGLRASGRAGSALGIGLGASRTPLDETANLIARGMAIQSADADADLALPHRLSLSAAASHASVEGGSVANARNAFSGAARWRARPNLTVGLSERTQGYRANGRPDAYFSPARFTLAELTASWTIGHELGWWGSVDAGAGPQSILFHSVTAGERGALSRKMAERLAAGTGYRFSPGVEIGVSGGVANVASPTAIGVADYRAYVFGIRGRVKL